MADISILGCPFVRQNHITLPHMHAKVSAVALETPDYSTGIPSFLPASVWCFVQGFADEALWVGMRFAHWHALPIAWAPFRMLLRITPVPFDSDWAISFKYTKTRQGSALSTTSNEKMGPFHTLSVSMTSPDETVRMVVLQN